MISDTNKLPGFQHLTSGAARLLLAYLTSPGGETMSEICHRAGIRTMDTYNLAEGVLWDLGFLMRDPDGRAMLKDLLKQE